MERIRKNGACAWNDSIEELLDFYGRGNYPALELLRVAVHRAKSLAAATQLISVIGQSEARPLKVVQLC